VEDEVEVMSASDNERGSTSTPPLRRTSGVSSNSAVVEESPHEALSYCNFEDFLEHLCLDQTSASSLAIAAAQQMFAAPLPPQWSEQVDETSSRVYFFNRATGDSLWMHPRKSIFEDLLQEVQSWQPDSSLEDIEARADAHLRQAQRNAVEALVQWSAFDAPQGPEEAPEFAESSQFYFNATTGESSWADPRQSVEFDLRLRHSILSECISAFRVLGLPDESSEGEVSSHADGRDLALPQAFGENLGELLGSLTLPLRHIERLELPKAGGPMRPNVSAGDETGRTELSYLTARSTTTEDRTDIAGMAR